MAAAPNGEGDFYPAWCKSINIPYCIIPAAILTQVAAMVARAFTLLDIFGTA